MSGTALGGPPLCLATLAVALALWLPSGAVRRRRLHRLGVDDGVVRPRRRPPRRGAPPGPVRRWVLAVPAGLGVAALLGGGPFGLAAGVGVAVLGERLLRRSGGGGRQPARAELPVVCDLLAVCLAAGTPLGTALEAVAAVVPGPLGQQLQEVGALHRLGASPRRAWAGAGAPVDALARVLVRAGESGSSVVPALQRLAADLRAGDRAGTEAAVQRAAVWVLAPLGLCFLPAFLCLGVVPLVLGIAADVFG